MRSTRFARMVMMRPQDEPRIGAGDLLDRLLGRPLSGGRA